MKHFAILPFLLTVALAGQGRPAEKEAALGKQLAQEVERYEKVIDDPTITGYVGRLARNLAQNSGASFPLTIRVIDSATAQDCALPGGYVYLSSALILRAETEAELAAALAHQIAHVAARHGIRSLARVTDPKSATVPLLFMGGWNGCGNLRPMALNAFQRAFEREADMLGLEYLYETGYDPAAFLDFLAKMRSLETDPLTEGRIESAEQTIRERLEPKPQTMVDTRDFLEVKERLRQRMLLQGRASPRPLPPSLHRRDEATPER